MESAALYLIFKRAFAGLSEATKPKQTQPQDASPLLEHHGARGPSVIRNTIIQLWLRTLSEEEVQWRAGFKTIESLHVIARGAGIETRSENDPQNPEHPDAAKTPEPHAGR